MGWLKTFRIQYVLLLCTKLDWTEELETNKKTKQKLNLERKKFVMNIKTGLMRWRYFELTI